MEAVVAPVLHNNAPVYALAVSVVLPQLFVTVIFGAATVDVRGAATAFAAALVQPFTVCFTENVPAVFTVIDGVVAPLLQRREPV